MFIDRIEAQPSWSGLVAVRLLRRWVATREMGQASLPALVEFGNELEISPQVVIALASVFQLTEASLGRPLEAECCCRSLLGRDERAVLLLLVSLPEASAPGASLAIPHGIPGALAWAVRSVRRLLEMEESDADFVVARCPFRTGS